MGLFNKKVTTEEIAKLIEQLSDEERAELFKQFSGEEQPEEQPKETKETEGAEETAEGEEQPETETEQAEGEQAEIAEEPQEEQIEEEPDKQATENRDEILQGLTERITALEEALKDFSELKQQMEEYTKKQADSFGLGKKQIGGLNKDMEDMSAEELKNRILSGQN